MSRRAAPVHARIGQRPDDPPGPAMHRQVLGQMAHEVAHRLARLGHQHRRHRRVEGHVVAARQHRGVGRVRRATEEPQQRHVVHARPRRRVQSQRIRHGQRQPARPQPVLHRLTGPEIRRQRQRDRQLRQATRSGVISHPPILPGIAIRAGRFRRISRGEGVSGESTCTSRDLRSQGLTLGGVGRWRRSVRCRGREAVGDCGGFASIGHVEFAQDVGDMDACGLVADEQGFGDVWVGVAASDETEDVDLSRREAERVRPARPSRRAVWARGRRGRAVLVGRAARPLAAVVRRRPGRQRCVRTAAGWQRPCGVRPRRRVPRSRASGNRPPTPGVRGGPRCWPRRTTCPARHGRGRGRTRLRQGPASRRRWV